MRWLEPELDGAYVELHRAAWSTMAPSTYTRELHDAVTAMPDFDRRLVPIVAARDGTLAEYCISWLDPHTRTVEIEPLGTHPGFRRLGLGRAIVAEVMRRAAAHDARSVLVWGAHANDAALHLYESSGLRSRRLLREYRRAL
jgi:ribosomal protein S18 acetylase RimI-like enzyme